MKIAARAERIAPFYVMEIAKAASQLAREVRGGDRPMIFLNIGEPDFTAPPLVREAAERAMRDGRTQYTDALGLPELRERISGWYASHFGLAVPASRIVVTAGASAALHLACMALIEAGDQVLMPDPGYPCNRHFVLAAEGEPVPLPTTPEHRFQPTAEQIGQAWTARTRGVLLASPANPTGTSVHPQEMARIHAQVTRRGGVLLVDEIYLGLSHEAEYGHSALALGEDLVSVNSFSKYFSMTGWRLGWLVLPPALVPVVERLAQNLFICPSTVAQHAALACFEPDSLAEYGRRRGEFKARRDWFIPRLQALGLPVPVVPDGAFYAWADCRDWCGLTGLANSWELAFDLMRRAHVAVTPGRDFGPATGERFLRFSTASAMAQLHEAVERLTALRARLA